MLGPPSLHPRSRRAVLVFVLLILIVALLLHWAFMGPHHSEASGCATCIIVAFSVVVVVAMLTFDRRFYALIAPWVSRAGDHPRVSDVGARPSRHPPDEGTVLRL